MICFDWDPEKNRLNIGKHGVSFDEAQTVFFDSDARLIHDPDHSEAEDRFLLLGYSRNERLLLVCHCYRHTEEVIRIISARKATKNERLYYGAQRKKR